MFQGTQAFVIPKPCLFSCPPQTALCQPGTRASFCTARSPGRFRRMASNIASTQGWCVCTADFSIFQLTALMKKFFTEQLCHPQAICWELNACATLEPYMLVVRLHLGAFSAWILPGQFLSVIPTMGVAPTPTRKSSPRSRATFPCVEILMLYHRPYWKRLARRAVEHSISQHNREYQVARFHSQALHFCRQQGNIEFDFADLRPLPVTQRFGCMQCQLAFRSKGGEGAHFFVCTTRSHQFGVFSIPPSAQHASRNTIYTCKAQSSPHPWDSMPTPASRPPCLCSACCRQWFNHGECAGDPSWSSATSSSRPRTSSPSSSAHWRVAVWHGAHRGMVWHHPTAAFQPFPGADIACTHRIPHNFLDNLQGYTWAVCQGPCPWGLARCGHFLWGCARHLHAACLFFILDLPSEQTLPQHGYVPYLCGKTCAASMLRLVARFIQYHELLAETDTFSMRSLEEDATEILNSTSISSATSTPTLQSMWSQ